MRWGGARDGAGIVMFRAKGVVEDPDCRERSQESGTDDLMGGVRTQTGHAVHILIFRQNPAPASLEENPTPVRP